MHCSRMCTGRSLTVCCSLLPGGGWMGLLGGVLLWGVPGWGGVFALGGTWSGGAWSGGGWVSGLGGVCSWGASVPGGVWSRGVWSGGSALGGCLVQGGVCLSRAGVGIPACTEADTPPPRGQTHACKNITLAQLRCGR